MLGEDTALRSYTNDADPEQHRNRVTAIKLISDPKLWRLEIFGNLPNVALANVIKPELSYKPYC